MRGNVRVNPGWGSLAASAVLFLSGCVVSSRSPATETPRIIPGHTEFPEISPAPTDAWEALLRTTPASMTTPVPPADETPIDGLYAHYDPSWPQWWSCLRCADYRPAGGLWRLQFDRGVMRIQYEVTQWRSLASYTVDGDTLRVFNDPYCPFDVGEYSWSQVSGELRLEAVDDVCSFGLRGQNLSTQPWASCEDLASLPYADDHLLRGCGELGLSAPAPLPSDLPVELRVLPGDSRKLSTPPEWYADANADNGDPVEGVTVTSSAESIAYGRYRVLWAPADWVEARIDRHFSSVGVQFLGAKVIGWARILFDGQEVWHGDASTLGEQSGLYGGYVELSEFASGTHAIRVERLEVDSRPVAVLFFGLRSQGVVQP